ncbi:MAG: putative metal-binding motif-containing protein, partial [Myxococcota bacterium]
MYHRWALRLVLFTLWGIFSCGEASVSETRRPVVDEDGDGYASPLFSGRDCDDRDATKNPASNEVLNNDIDDNCNGQVDELTVKTGVWRLTSTDPKQKNSHWLMYVRLDDRLGIQFVQCIRFQALLSSAELKKDTNLTFAIRDATVREASLVNNKVTWEHKPEGKSESFRLALTFSQTEQVSGELRVDDISPDIKGTATIQVQGTP